MTGPAKCDSIYNAPSNAQGGHYGEVSEWFKEPVLKTGDPQGPWVRIPPSPPFTTESSFANFALEKYSRGRRGAPAKGVGRETGARVQIPPSPPEKAPHEGAGLFVLLAGIWTRAPEGAGKKSDRRQWRIQGGFFGAAVGKAEAAAPADGRAAHRKRACEAGSNPTAATRGLLCLLFQIHIPFFHEMLPFLHKNRARCGCRFCDAPCLPFC